MTTYDEIGTTYAVGRRTDSRWMAAIDAAMAVLTVHHWESWRTGIQEMQRVAERQVLLVFDQHALEPFWLVRDYLPGLTAFERTRAPAFHALLEELGRPQVQPLPVPRNMTDGVLAAYWARPAAYLDPTVRACTSALVQMPQEMVRSAIDALRADLEDGTWARRNDELDTLETLDVGYRLLVSPE